MHILIVGDTSEQQALYRRYLLKSFTSAMKIDCVGTGEAALAAALKQWPDCILVNDELPDMSSLECLKALAASADLSLLPVILLVNEETDPIVEEALKVGAYYYLTKGRLTQENLHYAVINATEKTALLNQVQTQKQQIDHMAYYDPLTGIANRTQFEKALAKTVARAKRYSRHMALLMIDLDRFKKVNDLYGHEVGDSLLREAAQRFRLCIRENDTLARLSGDEFAIILDEVEEPHHASNVAHRLIESLSVPFTIDGFTAYVTPSIGIACYPDAGDTASIILQHADIALFQAKEQGRNCYRFFSVDLQSRKTQRLSLENALRNALTNQEFQLHFQSIIDVQTENVIGLEALLRWYNPQLGLVEPAQFIPVAEETGQMIAIGTWVIQNSLMNFKKWRDMGFSKLVLAINLSAKQLLIPNFQNIVQHYLNEFDLDPGSVILELTETAILQDLDRAKKVLDELCKIGCQIYIDDFGMGYSSLHVVRTLPITGLKIDQSFVKNILNSEKDAGILKSMILLATNLGLTVVAEGIENHEQLEFIRQHQGQHVQGFYLARPMDADAATAFLHQHISLPN